MSLPLRSSYSFAPRSVAAPAFWGVVVVSSGLLWGAGEASAKGVSHWVMHGPALPTNATAPASLLAFRATHDGSGTPGKAMARPSRNSLARAARATYLRTFRRSEFRLAAQTLGYTSGELSQLGKRLLRWSKQGQIKVQWNPLLGGVATDTELSISLPRLVRGERALRETVSHELIHLLQQVRFGALSKEQKPGLTRRERAYIEHQASAGGAIAVGKTPGRAEALYGQVTALLHP